jgi:uncharacterized membrane protein
MVTQELGQAQGTGTIDVAVEDLFHFSDWCYNDPKWAQFIRRAWITRLPGPDGTGMVSQYVGKIVGREMEWDGESIEWRNNELWARRAVSGLPAKMKMSIEMRFEALGPGATKLTCRIEYRVPYPIIGWLMDRFYVHREVRQMATSAIEGLKKVALGGGIQPISAQMEKRKDDHPGYQAT